MSGTPRPAVESAADRDNTWLYAGVVLVEVVVVVGIWLFQHYFGS
jgi:hypothetical protein